LNSIASSTSFCGSLAIETIVRIFTKFDSNSNVGRILLWPERCTCTVRPNLLPCPPVLRLSRSIKPPCLPTINIRTVARKPPTHLPFNRKSNLLRLVLVSALHLLLTSSTLDLSLFVFDISFILDFLDVVRCESCSTLFTLANAFSLTRPLPIALFSSYFCRSIDFQLTTNYKLGMSTLLPRAEFHYLALSLTPSLSLSLSLCLNTHKQSDCRLISSAHRTDDRNCFSIASFHYAPSSFILVTSWYFRLLPYCDSSIETPLNSLLTFTSLPIQASSPRAYFHINLF
jgi:hypothetical protein